MDVWTGLYTWVTLLGRVLALCLTICGVVVLVIGRTRSGQRASRRLTEVGLLCLCFGLGLALLTSASVLNKHDQPMLAFAAVIVGMALVGLAAVRYRLRQDKLR